MNAESLSRRTLIAGAAAVAAASAAPSGLAAQQERVIKNGRIRQSVCQWCFGRIPLEELAAAAKAMGLESIEILGPEAFPTLREHGLSCAMTNSHGIPKGINDPANHEACLEAITAAIDATADAGFPNVITFSGNPQRHGRQRGPGQLCRGPEAGRRPRRTEGGNDLHGAAELQGQPRGLHGPTTCPGWSNSSTGSPPTASRSSTTSTTRRSWRAT